MLSDCNIFNTLLSNKHVPYSDTVPLAERKIIGNWTISREGISCAILVFRLLKPTSLSLSDHLRDFGEDLSTSSWPYSGLRICNVSFVIAAKRRPCNFPVFLAHMLLKQKETCMGAYLSDSVQTKEKQVTGS